MHVLMLVGACKEEALVVRGITHILTIELQDPEKKFDGMEYMVLITDQNILISKCRQTTKTTN